MGFRHFEPMVVGLSALLRRVDLDFAFGRKIAEDETAF